MKAWVEEGGVVIAPFAAPASRLPVLNLALRDAMRAEMRAAGLEVVDAAPSEGGLVAGAGVYANAACLKALIAGATPAGARLALTARGWAAQAGGAPRREIDLCVVRGAAASRAQLPVVEIAADEAGVELARGPETLRVPAPRHVACEVRSWADLLWINLFAMAARVRSMTPAQGLGIVTLAVLRARSLNKWRIAGKLVARGRGCDVHPSAVVEASVLGDGVKIGPGAVVRGCVLGNGVEVEELALAVGSVLGDAARVQRQAMLKFSLVFPRAAVAGGVQLSVMGEGSSIRMGAYTLDRRLDGAPIRVRAGDGWALAGPTLGVAIGPGASVGSGVWIAAGRAIPAGVVIVRGASEVLTRIPEDLGPGVYAIESGEARPVARS